MENDQYASPVLIKNDEAIVLHRVPLQEKIYNEKWLQKLISKNSVMLPFTDLEPIYAGSVPITRELSTKAGPVDILCMNSKGYITLIETKLWRNPEARRTVIAQIIDYAKEISEWSYDDLISAIKSEKPDANNSDPLCDLFDRLVGQLPIRRHLVEVIAIPNRR